MQNEIIIALISGGSALGGVFATNLFNHFGSASRNKRDKRININEERYNKVFSPIQKLIYFNKNDKNLVNEVQTIIQDNFILATDNLKQEFKKSISNEALTSGFIDTVKIGCKCLENELGYTNEKLTKEEKKSHKNVVDELKQKSNTIPQLIFIQLILCVLLALIDISDIRSLSTRIIGNFSLSDSLQLTLIIVAISISISLYWKKSK